MRILALIPARSGSKRLPGKNIRPLAGTPLINWSIRSAQQSQAFCDILVSTDASEIAEIATAAGALVPWLRPTELASDSADPVDVALHALAWYEAQHGPVDGLMLLQPTLPFRKEATIHAAIALYVEHGQKPVVSVEHAAHHPAWCFRHEHGRLVPYHGWELMNSRSQDLPTAYCTNGVIYLVHPDTLRQDRTFVTEEALPLVMTDKNESIDIDTMEDWLAAEAAVRQNQEK